MLQLSQEWLGLDTYDKGFFQSRYLCSENSKQESYLITEVETILGFNQH